MAKYVPNIKTERLLLKNITEADTVNIVDWRSDYSVFRYFLSPHKITIEEHLNWYFNNYLQDIDRIDWMAFDISGQPIGIFGIKRNNSNDINAEISYIVNPNQRGNGYAYEAINSIIDFLKKVWNSKYIIAEIHKENVNSINFALKLGMKKINVNGNFNIYKKEILKDNHDFKKFLIRTDGNSTIGTGHVMRCLSIANMLRNYDVEVIFITADNSMNNFFENNYFKYIVLNKIWNDLEKELDEMLEVINLYNFNSILIDSYFVTENYIKRLNENAYVYYLDDLNLIKNFSNTIINYNIYAEDMTYNGNDETLLGTEYAPLREEFCGINSRIYSNLKNVLITSGGTDEYNAIGKLLEVIIGRNDFNNLNIYCILGKFNMHKESLNSIYKNYNNIHIISNINNMAEYMKKCDIAITASGTTCYEICACGLPAITYIIADNQINVAKYFSKKRIMPCIGDIRNDKIKYKEILNIEIDKLKDEKTWINRSKKMQQLVDGNGSERIAKKILEKLK